MHFKIPYMGSLVCKWREVNESQPNNANSHTAVLPVFHVVVLYIWPPFFFLTHLQHL